MIVSVASVQMAPERMCKHNNIEKMKKLVHETMKTEPSTKLIVFPELAISGCEGSKLEFDQLSEISGDGESFRAICEIAKAYSVHIVYGYPERDRLLEGVLYNSLSLIDDEGIVIGNYRKVHPFGNEILWMKPGFEFPVFDTKIGKIGLMNCWDCAFPEVARVYALKGVQILCASANWEAPYDYDWDLVTKARCMDNILPLIASNRVGTDLELSFFGHSCIISPIGRIIKSLDAAVEGIVCGILDLEEIRRYRVEYYSYFTDRKPESYKEIVEKSSAWTS